MEIIFLIVCIVSCLAIAFGISFALGRVEKIKKSKNNIAEWVGVVLAIAGLFCGFWLADVLKQSIIDQEHSRQYENCTNHDLTEEQCRYFQDSLNS